jgi:hypothetical protein
MDTQGGNGMKDGFKGYRRASPLIFHRSGCQDKSSLVEVIVVKETGNLGTGKKRPRVHLDSGQTVIHEDTGHMAPVLDTTRQSHGRKRIQEQLGCWL